MASVLLVSKALAPPWNDSSKNLARDVAEGLERHAPVVLTDGSGRFRPPRGRAEPVYASASRFAPGLAAQLRVLARLAAGPREPLWHFFFAPNPRTSTAARLLARARRAATVQTVCSRPRRLERAAGLLFADRTVVLSRHTRAALRDAGVPDARLAHVPPAVPPLSPLDAETRRAARAAFALDPDAPMLLYAGDLELGDGAPRTIESFARAPAESVLVMACRAKTAAAAEAEGRLRARSRALGLADRVRWVGETPRIHELVGCADVVTLPTRDLWAKMDLPLVLLEAMWMARPVIVAADTPAAELAEGGAAERVASDEELAHVTAALLEDAARRRAVGAAARRAAAERYHPARMVQAYERIYDEVLGR
jgi:phosphatidylinositol alpha-1,6-mannosyltransferase